MNNSLERLIEGMIATLRTDVIPKVTDPYARGQAIGVIDLFNNIAPRLEWRHVEIVGAIRERTRVIAEVRRHLPNAPGPASTSPSTSVDPEADSAELLAERDRLDGEISDLVAYAFGADRSEDGEAARQCLRNFMHDDAAGEMKLTRKPLFAEIARGGSDREDGP